MSNKHARVGCASCFASHASTAKRLVLRSPVQQGNIVVRETLPAAIAHLLHV